MSSLIANFNEQVVSSKPIKGSDNKNRIKFKDGSYYEGEVGKDGQMNGLGKLTIKKDLEFEGTFVEN